MARAEKKKYTKEFFRTRKHRAIIKHGQLEMYFQAFFPIMAQQAHIKNILVVDGFAGPGEYSDGSNGSPIMICKTLLTHKRFKGKPELLKKIHLVFVEANKSRTRRLKKNLRRYRKELFNIEVVQGEFKNHILEIMDKYKAQGMPMDVLRQVLAYPRTDLLVNLMDSSIRRWRQVNNKKELINKLLGSNEWQNIDRESKTFLEKFVNMYRENLERSILFGQMAERIRTLKFAMKNNNNSHIYHLVFATKHRKGIDIMKRAMYEHSGLRNGFMFSEWNPRTNAYEELQQRKLSIAQNAKDMAIIIKNKFIGQTVTGPEIEDFIRDTDYYFNFKCQLKKELGTYLVENENQTKRTAFVHLKYLFTEQNQTSNLQRKRKALNEPKAPVKKQRRTRVAKKADKVDKSQTTLTKYFWTKSDK